jgi:hypothetical protein
VIRLAEPNGLDAVFDGMVWGYLDRGFTLLRRGGAWVHTLPLRLARRP